MAPWGDDTKQGTTGLADKYQLTVRTARFKFPFKNAPTACALVLDGEQNIDGTLQDGHLWLNCGAFEPGDKEGTFAIHESQEMKPYNRNSKIFKFIKSAMEVGVPLEELQSADRAQYEDKDALIWEGLTLDIEEIETTGKLQSGEDAGKEFTSRQPYVRGWARAGEAPAASAPAAAATPAPANNGGAVTKEQATLLAKSKDNFLTYLEAVTQAGASVTDEVAQEAFYTAARG